MFYESRYPKKELKEIANQIYGFSKRFLLHESWLYELEKSCFIGFYFVRKLLESKYKVTDKIKKASIEIVSYNFIGKKGLYLPMWASDEYDYNNPNKENMRIMDLAHQFVHSQLFFWKKEWSGLRYVYVSSDQNIYHKIYEIDVSKIIEIFKSFSEDSVSEIRSKYDVNWWVLVECL